MSEALVTVAVPSFNQGFYLDAALHSLFAQDIPLEVFVADGGSTDNSLEVIENWSPHLAGWRSHKDTGQAAAINESIARGSAPFVAWLNSDDLLEPGGLKALLDALERKERAPAAYGRSYNLDDATGRKSPVWVEPFNVDRLALRCFVSQPASLIRRSAWESVNGLDDTLHMSMDYDLWWRLWKLAGPLEFVDRIVATNRVHDGTKTRNFRAQHYAESIAVVRRHYGSVPVKWVLWRPYAVWAKTLFPHLP